MFNSAEKQIIAQAVAIIESKAKIGAVMFNSAWAVRDYLKCSLVPNEREVFKVLALDSQHRLIDACDLFGGTIDSAAVYPREVVKYALSKNAAAVIIAHNHPSGHVEPSNADIAITGRIQKALELVDIKLLDHFVVGFEGAVSLAERGHI